MPDDPDEDYNVFASIGKMFLDPLWWVIFWMAIVANVSIMFLLQDSPRFGVFIASICVATVFGTAYNIIREDD